MAQGQGASLLEDTPAQLDPIEAKQDWDAKTQQMSPF